MVCTTLRWRKTDSNHRSRPVKETAAERGSAANLPASPFGTSRHPVLRAGLMVRIRFPPGEGRANSGTDAARGSDRGYGPALALAALCCCRLVSDGRSEDPAVDARRGADLARWAVKAHGDDPGVLALVAQPPAGGRVLIPSPVRCAQSLLSDRVRTAGRYRCIIAHLRWPISDQRSPKGQCDRNERGRPTNGATG